MRTSNVEVHIEAEHGVDGFTVDPLSEGRMSVRLTLASHLDVWVQGTRGDLNDWALAVLGAILRATKIASSPTDAASTEASPPPVSPTPAAGRKFGEPI